MFKNQLKIETQKEHIEKVTNGRKAYTMPILLLPLFTTTIAIQNIDPTANQIEMG